MKLLVLALYAQYRVGAGRMGLWAARNGMREMDPPSFEALFSWLNDTAALAALIGYGLRIKPIMRCTFYKNDAVDRCSLP